MNQSWKEIYVWDGKEPNYQSVIRKYKTEDTKEGIEKTIAQLKSVAALGKGFDEEQWTDVLTWGLSLNYYPPGVGQNYEDWLTDVLRILEEPMDETLAHFIPERI